MAWWDPIKRTPGGRVMGAGSPRKSWDTAFGYARRTPGGRIMFGDGKPSTANAPSSSTSTLSSADALSLQRKMERDTLDKGYQWNSDWGQKAYNDITAPREYAPPPPPGWQDVAFERMANPYQNVSNPYAAELAGLPERNAQATKILQDLMNERVGQMASTGAEYAGVTRGAVGQQQGDTKAAMASLAAAQRAGVGQAVPKGGGRAGEAQLLSGIASAGSKPAAAALAAQGANYGGLLRSTGANWEGYSKGMTQGIQREAVARAAEQQANQGAAERGLRQKQAEFLYNLTGKRAEFDLQQQQMENQINSQNATGRNNYAMQLWQQQQQTAQDEFQTDQDWYSASIDMGVDPYLRFKDRREWERQMSTKAAAARNPQLTG